MKINNRIWRQPFMVLGLLLIFSISCKKEDAQSNINTEDNYSLTWLAEGSSPVWSPDGSKIAYLTDNALYSMNSVDGTNKQKLATDVLTPAVWSPSGKYILFTGNFSLLYRINADGSNKVNLLAPETFASYVPSWSPDEKQIAFVVMGDLYLVNNDGSNLHRLTPQLSYVSPYQTPCWTPDGASLLFLSGFDTEHDIYFIDSNGENLRRLENSSIYEEEAQLSLDGTKIYFAAAALPNDIFRINSDGSGMTNLTNNIGDIHSQRLSPDGTKIAFPIISNVVGEDGLDVMSSDGSGLKNLYNQQKVFDVSWSPDSRKIAFGIFNNRTSRIYTVEVPK
jgi:TolB protein